MKFIDAYNIMQKVADNPEVDVYIHNGHWVIEEKIIRMEVENGK